MVDSPFVVANELTSSRPLWGSVRKVRFKSQISSLIKYAVENDHRRFAKEDIRKIIEEDRKNREYLRLLITQVGSRKTLRALGDRTRSAYEKSAEDTIAFAKGVGIFRIQEDLLICPPAIKELDRSLHSNQAEFDARLVELLLDSKYSAYSSFVLRLHEQRGHIHIPGRFHSRTRASGFTDYIRENGFSTDSASFYAIRDLLYGLDLLNWRIDSESANEHIFLTCEPVGADSIPKAEYSRKARLRDFTLHFGKSVSYEQFKDVLTQNYFKTSGGSDGVILDLLELRDRITEELQISDGNFNSLLVGLWKLRPELLHMELSQGIISNRRLSGILTKALNAPMIGDRLYATYIRISGRNRE